MRALTNRYDIVFLFDAAHAASDDAIRTGGRPRHDPDTGHGLVSDVFLKRHIRNYTEQARGGLPGYHIHVQDRSIEETDDVEGGAPARDLPSALQGAIRENAAAAACEQFFDIRAFGTVLAAGSQGKQVRGPVQISFATSVEPIMLFRPASRGNGPAGAPDAVAPYGLYRTHIFVNAKLAAKTGFTTRDLNHLFDALIMMFHQQPRGPAPGKMTSRRIIAFKHASALGNAPAQALFDRVTVRRVADTEASPADVKAALWSPPRGYADYAVGIDSRDLPQTVEILDIL